MLQALLMLAAAAAVAPLPAQPAQPEPPLAAPPKASPTSRELRAQSHVSAILVPYSIGLLLPGKRGVQVAYVHSDAWTFEGEYLSAGYGLKYGSVNFASFEESLELLRARRYFGNSFALGFGAGMRSYALELGDDLLEGAGVQSVSSAHVAVDTYVAHIGASNTWQVGPGFTFGADWLELYVPFGGRIDDSGVEHLPDEGDRDNTRKVLRALRQLPTFTAAKLRLGWTF